MYLKILGHPVFPNLNFHMPMIVDLSHPLIMLRGENGCGKSTLLHSIYYALRGEQVEGYIYRLEPGDVKIASTFLFDAEQHNPRQQLEFFAGQPEMLDFLKTASHGQVMLALFRESFPRLPEGSILLLDEPASGLDPEARANLSDLLRALGAEQVWANGRDTALGFYLTAGWRTVEGSEHLSPETQLPHTAIYKILA